MREWTFRNKDLMPKKVFTVGAVCFLPNSLVMLLIVIIFLGGGSRSVVAFSSVTGRREISPSVRMQPSQVSTDDSLSPCSAGTPERKRALKLADLALAGAIAAALGDATLHPVDCIKTLQQSDSGYGMTVLVAARSIWDSLGPLGFYRGLTTYAAADATASAVRLTSYEGLKQWFASRIPEKHLAIAFFICAAFAFVVSSIVVVPGELIKQRMQMGYAASSLEAVSLIWHSDGFAGFFTGYSGVLLRDVPYTMLELGLYDNFKRWYLNMKNQQGEHNVKEITLLDEIVAGGVTGGITGYLTTPFDTIKTKLMVDNCTGEYAGFLDCMTKTVGEHGWDSVFQGGAARVAWLVPFTAIYLPCYDLIKRKLEEFNVDNVPVQQPTVVKRKLNNQR